MNCYIGTIFVNNPLKIENMQFVECQQIFAALPCSLKITQRGGGGVEGKRIGYFQEP